jgi:hypothetical protein
MLTLLDIDKEVERIRAMAGDDEAAHSAEDDLRERVLAMIADGSASDPQAYAEAVLKTNEIDFQRWCA